MDQIKSQKQRIFGVLEPMDKDSRIFDFFIITLIILNVIVFILETVPAINNMYGLIFYAFEVFSVVVFSIEYALRVWTCNINEKFQDPILGRARYILTPLALIDLMAILPFYLPLLLPNLIFIRGFRVLRIFRILKLNRYSESAMILGKVVRQKSGFLIVLFSINLIMLFLTSGAMYLAENKAQPEVFSDMFTSLWFGVETLSGIGYGDMIPQTLLGRLIGFVILTIGVEMYLIPAGVITSGLIEELETKREKSGICPRCGRHLDEDHRESDKGKSW
jgi:voltage-gated potassium channel